MSSRRTKKYLEDDDDGAAYYDDDAHDAYDPRQHPSSKRAKAMKDPDPVTQRTLAIPSQYHRLIIGKGGSTLRQLEADYLVQIDVPPKDLKSDMIVVDGRNSDIDQLKTEIDRLIAEEKLLAVRKTAASQPVQQRASAAQPAKGLAATGATEALFPTLPGQEVVTISVDVEKFAHGRFIGTQATRLDELRRRLTQQGPGVPIVFKHGGIDVSVPEKSDLSSIITIRAPQYLASHCERTVREFINFYELTPHLRGIQVGGSVAATLATGDIGRGETVSARRQTAAVPAAPSKTPGASSTVAASATSHVDPTRGASGSDIAAASPQGSSGAPRRALRRPHGPFVDLFETDSYDHPVLPHRLR